MADIVMRDVEPGDVEYLIENIRALDLQEVQAMAGKGRWQKAMHMGVRCSLYAKTCVINGKVAAIIGAGPLSMAHAEGVPWMLGTDQVDENPRAVMALSRQYIPQMLALFPSLVNYVDARNTRSVKYLARLGFKISPPEPFGPYGLLFHKFEMKADHV